MLHRKKNGSRASVVCFGVFFYNSFSPKKIQELHGFFSAFDTLQIKESVILQTVKFMRLLIRIRLGLCFFCSGRLYPLKRFHMQLYLL